MKRYSIIFVLFSVCATLMAQGLTLKSSQAATNDPSARTKPRLDLNGKDCALKKAEEKLRITVKGVSFNMIKVKAGSFQINEMTQVVDEHSDTLCHSTVHEFTLTNDFYFGETEVTQDLWTAVMGSNPSSFRGPHFPVEQVSWFDCLDFIIKLNALTGRTFRLPTEGEYWFVVTDGKGLSDTTVTGGETIYDENDKNDEGWEEMIFEYKPHDVATEAPNELGIYFTTGIEEWRQDKWKHDYYRYSPSTNPTGPTTGSYTMILNNHWYFVNYDLRVAYRLSFDPSTKESFIGLRLVLTVPD